MRADAHRPPYQDSDFLWYQLLARSFVDAEDALRRFDAGEFLHEANGGGDHLAESLYGDSLFGRSFIEQRWAHLLELVRFDDKPYGLPQACFVLRRPDPGAPGRRWPARARLRASLVTSQVRTAAPVTARRLGRAARHPSLVVRRVRGTSSARPASGPGESADPAPGA